MMKKYAFYKDVRKLSKENFLLATIEQPIPEKDAILSYMKKFRCSAFTSEPVSDRLTGEIVAEADNQRTDGVYVWYESWIYHFEKYNLKLNDDFIEYVLNALSNQSGFSCNRNPLRESERGEQSNEVKEQRKA